MNIKGMKKMRSVQTTMGEPERRGGERSEAPRSAGSPIVDRPAATPDPEVPAQAVRRRYSAEYKLEILRQADRCSQPGEIGALLRREGLYSSLLTTWRRQRDEGALEGLHPQKRGRKAVPQNPLARRVAELERENRRLGRRLQQAETIIGVQKKVAEILGIPLNRPDSEGDD